MAEGSISDSWQIHESVLTKLILVMSDELQVGVHLSITVFVACLRAKAIDWKVDGFQHEFLLITRNSLL